MLLVFVARSVLRLRPRGASASAGRSATRTRGRPPARRVDRYTTAFASTRGRSRAEATRSFPSTAPSSRITSSPRRTASSHAGSRPRCNEHLLTREPYRSYGVTLDELFARGSFRVHEDLYLLSDQVFGWDDDYSILRGPGSKECARPRHLHARRARDVWDQLSKAFFRSVPPGGAAASARPRGEDTVKVDGRIFRADRGRADPRRTGRLDLSTRQRIHQVWTSPTKWHFEFDNPADRARFDRVQARRDDLFDALPDRRGNATLALRLRPALAVVSKAVALDPRRASGSLSRGVRAALQRSCARRSPRSRSSSSTRSASSPTCTSCCPSRPRSSCSVSAGCSGRGRRHYACARDEGTHGSETSERAHALRRATGYGLGPPSAHVPRHRCAAIGNDLAQRLPRRAPGDPQRRREGGRSTSTGTTRRAIAGIERAFRSSSARRSCAGEPASRPPSARRHPTTCSIRGPRRACTRSIPG